MSKWTSFATGMGEGYLSGKRYQDTKKRADRQDAALDKIAGIEPGTAESDEAEDRRGLFNRFRSWIGAEKMADGGVVGGMPSHHDKMDWQRGSFKK